MKHRTEIKTITCRQSLDKVYEFIDGEAHPQTQQEIEKHLATCNDCYGKFRFEKMLKEKIKKLAVKADATDSMMKLERILKKIT
jgi:mycothiol system anti-sigma-R factor